MNDTCGAPGQGAGGGGDALLPRLHPRPLLGGAVGHVEFRFFGVGRQL